MAEAVARELPLFPLHTVLFPGGLLGLRVFEARYLDLIATCLREREAFGVIALKPHSGNADHADRFEAVGTCAELLDVDRGRPGELQARCRGMQRFRVASCRRSADGLWRANATPVDDDPVLAPAGPALGAVRALASTIATLRAKGEAPFLPPYRFDDAGWVANRWCEILPIPQAAKQRLMELPDPSARLRLVDEFLRGKGLVS